MLVYDFVQLKSVISLYFSKVVKPESGKIVVSGEISPLRFGLLVRKTDKSYLLVPTPGYREYCIEIFAVTVEPEFQRKGVFTKFIHLLRKLTNLPIYLRCSNRSFADSLLGYGWEIIKDKKGELVLRLPPPDDGYEVVRMGKKFYQSISVLA
jgi:hypothetical protein